MKQTQKTVYRPRLIFKEVKKQGYVGKFYLLDFNQSKRLKSKPYANKWLLSSICCDGIYYTRIMKPIPVEDYPEHLKMWAVAQ